MSALPPDVERFVTACIPSVAHMEALLLLRSRDGEDLDTSAVAAALFIEERVARVVLGDLCVRGLVHAGALARYRYSPYSFELRMAVDELAETYRTRLVPLSRFIHERAEAHSLKDFANAFRLRKD